MQELLVLRTRPFWCHTMFKYNALPNITHTLPNNRLKLYEADAKHFLDNITVKDKYQIPITGRHTALFLLLQSWNLLSWRSQYEDTVSQTHIQISARTYTNLNTCITHILHPTDEWNTITWKTYGCASKCASRKEKVCAPQGQHLVSLLICASHISRCTWTRHFQSNRHTPLRLWVAQWGSQISAT